jgi:hypothetical protein
MPFRPPATTARWRALADPQSRDRPNAQISDVQARRERRVLPYTQCPDVGTIGRSLPAPV